MHGVEHIRLILHHSLKSSVFLYLAQQPNVRQGRLILKVFRLHTKTPQSAGLLWMGDQFVEEIST
jgi:hypothetical protein